MFFMAFVSFEFPEHIEHLHQVSGIRIHGIPKNLCEILTRGVVVVSPKREVER